jgi:hypothetical protein
MARISRLSTIVLADVKPLEIGIWAVFRPVRTGLPGCGRLSMLCEIGCLPPRMQRQMWRAEQSRPEMRGRFLVTVIATKLPQGDLYP